MHAEKTSNLSSNVSVVICTRNVEFDITDCILAIKRNHPREILVVDGMSTDRTIERVNALNVRCVSDRGRGLAYARRLGVENTSGELIMFVGPDNLLAENFIDKFVRLRKKWGFDVASVSTRTANPKTYWDRGMDFRWVCNMGTPGEIDVPGTPNIYDRKLFQIENFSDQDLAGADDTDLCERLKSHGFKLGIVPLVVYEKNGWTKQSIWNRFKFYGSGDSCFYSSYRSGWTCKRRFMSISHPLRQTIDYSKRAIREGRVSLLPWLIYTMVARYYGWMTYRRGDLQNFSNY